MDRPSLRPVTDVKRNATRIIARLRKDRQPVLITEHGRSAAMLVDVETWDEVQRRLEVLEAIARGERALSEGRTVKHAHARKRLKRWLKPGR